MAIQNSTSRWSAVSHTEYEPEPVHIEAASTRRFPALRILGQASTQLKELLPQIRAAIESSGFRLPKREILISLSQTRTPKSGHHLHFAIAVALLRLRETSLAGLSETALRSKSVLLSAEMDLSGNLLSVGYAHRTLLVAFQHVYDEVWIAHDDLPRYQRALSHFEIQLPAHLRIHIRTFKTLSDLKTESSSVSIETLLRERPKIEETVSSSSSALELPRDLSAEQVRLLSVSKIANLSTLLLGSQGTGKTSLLEWFRAEPLGVPGVDLQAIAVQQELETPLASQFPRPFVSLSPFSKISDLQGEYRGGILNKSGILSRAHGGVLVADEIAEASREVREYLRETLSHKRFTSRSTGVWIPSEFHFIATANPCRCGGWPTAWYESISDMYTFESQTQACTCSKHALRTYSQRLLGPFFDRMECVILFPPRQGAEQPQQMRFEFIKEAKGCFKNENWNSLPPAPLRRRYDRLSLRARAQWSQLAQALHAIEIVHQSAPNLMALWEEAHHVLIERKEAIKKHYQND